MTVYTVTIGKLTGATITADVDNITNVSLTVSPPSNDTNNLSLQVDDTISWVIDGSLADWQISEIGIGKKLANKNSVATQAVFNTKTERPTLAVGPADIFDLREIDGTMSEIKTIDGGENSDSKVEFKYRINFTGKNNWFIDPEVDVTPAMTPGPEADVTDKATTPFGPVKTNTLYAVVSAGGDIERGVGARQGTKLQNSAGQYKVTFNVDVSLGCFTATTAAVGSPGPALFATVSLDENDKTTVNVNVFDTAGTSQDHGFYLSVTTAYGAQSMT